MTFIISRSTESTKAAISMFSFFGSTLDAKCIFMRPTIAGAVSSFFMMREMIGSVRKQKVFNSIIKFIAVKMVDYFRPQKVFTQMLLHEPPMKINNSAPVGQSHSHISRVFIEIRSWFPSGFNFTRIAPSSLSIGTIAFWASIHADIYNTGRAT